MTLISGGDKDAGVLNDRPEINKNGAECLHFVKAERRITKRRLTTLCITWKNGFTLITSKLKVRGKC